MTVPETIKEYPLFDVAVLEHRFARHMRDYLLLAEVDWCGAEGSYLYRFTHCVVAEYETRVRDDVWPESWEDALTDYDRWLEAGEPAGFVWGVKWAEAYPGLEYVADSKLARKWSDRLGHPMHEAILETNAFFLRLVFHYLTVEKVSDKADVITRVNIPLDE